MSLHGFNYTIKWSDDFTTLDEPPFGKEHLVAFTEAPAGTFGGMEIKYNSESELYFFKHSKIKVRIQMDKSKSWVLSDAKTDKLKKHEQLHYNISALSGRDLERGLKALTAESPEELAALRDNLTLEMQNLVDEINKEYDNTILWGTDHGRINLHQEVWELHIKKLMNDPNARLESVYAVMRR